MKSSLREAVTGRYLAPEDPAFAEVHRIQEENEARMVGLNQHFYPKKEFLQRLSEITGAAIDESVMVLPPFYTDFGRHLSFGKHVFVNRGVMFTDLGGITLEDHVLIGPGARLLTVNHPVDPAKRRGVVAEPIRVRRNAWVGAGATILPGVTVGENAIVAANATVTRDVPDNVIVAGTPAKVVKRITESERIGLL